MSEELRKNVLSFIRESEIMEIDDEPGIEAYKDLQINNTTNEKTQVRLYHELIDALDELMVQESTRESTYDEVKEELLQSEKMAFLKKDGEIPSDEELLRFLKQVQRIRRMVIDSTTMTLPILRSVHQVEGLTSKEAGIAAKLEKRDDLIDDIITLENEVSQKQEKLNELTKEVQSKFNKSKELTTQLRNRTKQTTKIDDIDTQEIKIQLQQKLEVAKNKSFSLTEEIQAFIVENGINWANDEKLRDLILYCGEIYK